MKQTARLVLIAGISGILLAGCCAPRQAAATREWEYRVVTAHLDKVQGELNAAGVDGWEAVSAVNRDLYATVVLKRVKK